MKRVRPPAAASPPSVFDRAAPLSPFLIHELAGGCRGLIVDGVTKGLGGRWIIRLADGKGSPIKNPAEGSGFTLAEAKACLDHLPRRSH
jgi:hypothetical protein